MKLSTNWLKELVSYRGSIEKVAQDLTMAGLEVEKTEPVPGQKDTFFEIEITTNRPDWISHMGVAREIAAIQKCPLKIPKIKSVASRTFPVGWKVEIKDLEKCPYYTAVLIEGVQHKPTPDFIKKRLAACGLRSIGLIVDITNYVLLETGQPLHAFDADLLQGKQIFVRTAKAKEKFIAIDGSENVLTSEDLVIADQNHVVALAGVMGGQNTEVSEKTQNILLESAFFQPRTVRLTSKKHALASDSSYRFERRVDPEGVDFASTRALQLIAEYAKPKKISKVLKSGKVPSASAKPILLSVSDVENALGLPLKAIEIRSILTRLGLKLTPATKSSFKIAVPSFRSDLTRPVDLIEEVARIHGYDKIPETLPVDIFLHPEEDLWSKLEGESRNTLSGLGIDEAVTFSLISSQGLDSEQDLKDAVSIINPQNRELCWMRPTLVTSLLQVVKHNANVGAKRVAMYEIANVYRQPKGSKASAEEKVIGIILFGEWKEKNWIDPDRSASFYDLKGIVSSLLRASRMRDFEFGPVKKSYLAGESSEQITCGNQGVGFVGEINPQVAKLWDIEGSVFYAEVSLNAMAACRALPEAIQEIPRYPSIDRDLAVIVADSVKAGEIQKEIVNVGTRHASSLLRSVVLFDLFRGGRVPKGYKNLAFRLTYQSHEKTLISEDIQVLHAKIAEDITHKFQATFQ